MPTITRRGRGFTTDQQVDPKGNVATLVYELVMIDDLKYKQTKQNSDSLDDDQ